MDGPRVGEEAFRREVAFRREITLRRRITLRVGIAPTAGDPVVGRAASVGHLPPARTRMAKDGTS